MNTRIVHIFGKQICNELKDQIIRILSQAIKFRKIIGFKFFFFFFFYAECLQLIKQVMIHTFDRLEISKSNNSGRTISRFL